jgi:hypothetical protein
MPMGDSENARAHMNLATRGDCGHLRQWYFDGVSPKQLICADPCCVKGKGVNAANQITVVVVPKRLPSVTGSYTVSGIPSSSRTRCSETSSRR